MDNILLAVVIIIIGYIFYKLITMYCGKEYLVSKPNKQQKKDMIREVMKNKKMFTNKYRMDDVKVKIPWMDAVSYEDLRRLYRTNKFTNSSVDNIFN